jgi:hypothetical protein
MTTLIIVVCVLILIRSGLLHSLVLAAAWLVPLLAVLLIVAGSVQAGEVHPYAELGAGYNTSIANTGAWQWDNAGGVGFYGEIGAEFDTPIDNVTVLVHYVHISQWDKGPPFNDTGESSVDHFGAAVRYTW